MPARADLRRDADTVELGGALRAAQLLHLAAEVGHLHTGQLGRERVDELVMHRALGHPRADVAGDKQRGLRLQDGIEHRAQHRRITPLHAERLAHAGDPESGPGPDFLRRVLPAHEQHLAPRATGLHDHERGAGFVEARQVAEVHLLMERDEIGHRFTATECEQHAVGHGIDHCGAARGELRLRDLGGEGARGEHGREQREQGAERTTHAGLREGVEHRRYFARPRRVLRPAVRLGKA